MRRFTMWFQDYVYPRYRVEVIPVVVTRIEQYTRRP